MKQLNEKVAIVTGAGQGIGKGIALCLAKRGVKIVATGRRLEPIEQTIAEIKELGGDGFAMSCDSADRAKVEEVVKATVDTYGTVDVVVNNAQAIVPSAPVEETTYENMLKAWESGVIGSLNYMQAAFPYMKEQHEGRIINFASATGMFGIAGQLAYGSNKEALRGLTKIAAKEWGQYGICVNIVLPVHANMDGVIKEAGNGLAAPRVAGEENVTPHVPLVTVNVILHSDILHIKHLLIGGVSENCQNARSAVLFALCRAIFP